MQPEAAPTVVLTATAATTLDTSSVPGAVIIRLLPGLNPASKHRLGGGRGGVGEEARELRGRWRKAS